MVVTVQWSQKAFAAGSGVVLMCVLEGLESQQEETGWGIVHI